MDRDIDYSDLLSVAPGPEPEPDDDAEAADDSLSSPTRIQVERPQPFRFL